MDRQRETLTRELLLSFNIPYLLFEKYKHIVLHYSRYRTIKFLNRNSFTVQINHISITCIHIHIRNIYIYIYIYRGRERERQRQRQREKERERERDVRIGKSVKMRRNKWKWGLKKKLTFGHKSNFFFQTKYHF